ncbi:MAG: LamG domain-containing protein [Chitinophagaceae bacterium]|nr:LamG domain-containing protein [Chitinophagaceae bacterium]
MKRILVCCLLLVTQVCVAQVNLDKGLMAYYPFNGNAKDASGNKNHPVFNNATITADRFGNHNSAYHFNGVYQYMRISNKPTLNFSDQISLSVWVRPTGFYYDICHASQVISKGGGNYNPGNYALRFDDALYTLGTGCNGSLCDTLHQNFRGTGTVLTPYGGDFINKNQWYNVLYTNDGKTAKLYVDCELKYSVVFPETFTNNEDLFFGKSDDPFFPFWLNGDLDDIRIYNRALNDEEIFNLCKENEVKKDTTPVVPANELVLEKRKNELVKEITVDQDSISVTLYDNSIIDGDSITLIYNDKILATHLLLTEKPKTFYIKIAPGSSRNELVMYAENLGSIPPNTALMVIYDGNKRYELNISSSKTTNGVVSFKLRE